jgi:hypothetical protein
VKITWSDQQSLAQQISGFKDATSLGRFKMDMNIGATKFLSRLSREYTRISRFTDLVATQQYYQFPADDMKLKEVIVSTGSYKPPMEQIPDEFAWRMMNMLNIQGFPSHFWIRGNSEFGLYPTPAYNVTKGIEMVFSLQHIQLTQDDFKTGSVTVAQNSQTITHSANGFTASMVGSWFQNTDGTDENFYQVKDFVNTSTLTLKNFYQGAGETTSSFRVGQVMNIPEAFLEGPVDYAMYRHYLKRGNDNRAAEFKALFEQSLEEAKETYGNVTESQVITAEPIFRRYNPFRGDPPANITA